MVSFRRVKITKTRPYTISLSLEEIDTIISFIPKNTRKELNIVGRLRGAIYEEYKRRKIKIKQD